jgi:hypothetical protein
MHDELSVWADELQSRDDPWGELAATSLALERETDPELADPLAARLRELEADVMLPRLGPDLGKRPGVVPTWQHGALVGLSLGNREVLEWTRELLRLPAARFLWFLRVDLSKSMQIHDHFQMLRLVLDDRVEVRPRVLVLGSPPRHSGRRSTVDPFTPSPSRRMTRRSRQDLAGSLAPHATELRSLFVQSERYGLSWAKGDAGTRMQHFEPLALRIRADPARCSPADQTALARALWDPSVRIQIAALECVLELGADAAPFVPELALVDRGDPQWCERVQQALAWMANQPEIVARVATDFVAEQVGALRWLPMRAQWTTTSERGSVACCRIPGGRAGSPAS